MPDRIDELIQRRAKLVDEQRSILDKSESEDRAMNTEENDSYRSLGSDIGDLESRIKTINDQRAQDRSLAEAEMGSRLHSVTETDRDPNAGSEERAYRDAFNKFLRNPEELDSDEFRMLQGGYSFTDDEQRVQEVKTAGKGGYLVPTSLQRQLIDYLEVFGAVRSRANVIQTSGGEPMDFPRVTAHGAASVLAESTTKPFVDETFDKVSLGAFKYVKGVKVTWELLQDSAVDIEAFLAREIGRRIGVLEGQHFAVGASGSTTTPEGVVTKSTTVSAGAAGAPTTDDLLGLIYAVNAAYRPGSVFMMNDTRALGIRKLKASGSGEYIWQTSFQAGQPENLLGYPVLSEPNMASTTVAADKMVLFGNLNQAYYIRDVGGISIRRLDERFADDNMVAFIGEHRTDGDLLDANATRVLVAV